MNHVGQFSLPRAPSHPRCPGHHPIIYPCSWSLVDTSPPSPRPSLTQALLQMVLQDENFVSKEEFQAVEKKLVVSNTISRLLIFPNFPGPLLLS